MAGKRRDNGLGCTTRLASGTYRGYLTLDSSARKWVSGKTEREVKAKLAELRRETEHGRLDFTAKQTLAQFVEYWLETVVKPHRQVRTVARYEQILRVHVLPTLRHVLLAKLTAQHLTALYAARRKDGVSAETLAHVHTVLHTALRHALRCDLVVRNVTEAVDKPKASYRRPEPLDATQARTLLETAKDHRLYALFVLALATGMRAGEVLALRWKDVDLSKGTVRVERTLQPARNAPAVFDTPKTERSRRILDIGPTVATVLREHKVRQNAERLAMGVAWHDLGLVFSNTIGKPLDGIHLLRREFYPLLERAGLPKVRFHDLRHTAATLQLGESHDLTAVSATLGHAHTSTTANIYAHALPNGRRQVAASMDQLLFG